MKYLKLICTLLFLLATFRGSMAQIIQANQITTSVRQYEKVEWEIQLIEQWYNPYFMQDIALDMELRSPSGKLLIVPCFYDSGESGKLSNWKARFMAQESGNYTCKFKLSKNGKLVSELPIKSFRSEVSGKKGILHANDNYTFIFDNGEPFRGLGENICWEARSNDDSKYFKTLHENPRFNYEYMLRKLAANGGNFTRIWISPWNFPIEWKEVSPNTNRYLNSTEYFNPSAIAKLDRLFELSDSLGVHIMLCFSGTGGFDESNYGLKGGGVALNDSALWANPISKEQYKNKLRYFIARWGYSPSIGAWEFYNEVNWFAFSKDTSDHRRPKLAVAWHDEMSTFLKENDPYRHLITTSIAQTEVEGLNSVKNIDFNQIHVYDNIIPLFDIPALIDDHIAKFQKPYIIGEFAHESDWLKNFDLDADDMDSDFKRGLWIGLFSPAPILPLSWWWEYFENRGMMNYFARVRVILDQMMRDGKGSYVPVEVAVKDPSTKVYGVKCGKTTFVYLFNPNPVTMASSIEVQCKNKPQNIQIYTCDNGRYESTSQFGMKEGKLKLSKIELVAKTDKVIIIKST
jgi:hypothetical protein